MGLRAAVAIRRSIWTAALITLASCGGGGGDAGTSVFNGPGAGTPPWDGNGGGGTQTGDGPVPQPDATVTVSTAAVQGQVLSAASGAALAGAPVRFGAISQTTDTSGFFSEANFAATTRLVVNAATIGYEEMFLPTRVVTGVPAVAVFKLTPEGTTGSITVGAGGTVQAASGPGRVTFAPNSLESAPGVPAAGPVSVRLTPIAVGADSFLLSGDYTSNLGAQLETFGGVVLTNSAGAQIAAATPALLRIPVSTRTSAPPSSARLFYLDTASASWVEAGTATLVNDAAGPYYEGSVARFGQWMVGDVIGSPVIVRGCVADETGARVADARIVAEGIDYSGLAYANTNATGDFALPVKPNSQLIVTGRRGAILTNATTVTTAAADVTLPACLTLPSTNAATVRLTWGASPSDIDSHLHVPGGVHVFYPSGSRGSLTAEPFANLDVDDVTGFGPEITTIRRPKVGIYRFYLHNFSQTFSPGMTGSPARVELNYAGRVVAFAPPAGEGSNLYWHLFDLQIGSDCSMTLYRYNRWRADEPANPNPTGTAQACVPS